MRAIPASEVFRNGAGKPVVGLDIDGTLGDYHGHFLRFAEGWLGYPMPKSHDINPGMRLSEFMNLTPETYRKIKLAYRQGGMKRTMPAHPGAAWMTNRIHKEGAEIWLCTTRPYNKLDNIDADTTEWLARNRIEYDAVLFDDGKGHGKFQELVRQVGLGRIVAVADDLTDNLKEAEKASIGRRYLYAQPYNLQGVDNSGMIRVPSIYDLGHSIMTDIARWETSNVLRARRAASAIRVQQASWR